MDTYIRSPKQDNVAQGFSGRGGMMGTRRFKAIFGLGGLGSHEQESPKIHPNIIFLIIRIFAKKSRRFPKT